MAKEVLEDNQLNVQVQRHSEGIRVKVSYVAPLSACNAFAFLTDYGGAKQITGIKESKILSRVENVVLVERLVEQRVLGFAVEMHSIEKYTEESQQKLSFEQVEGDAKIYKGTWKLFPEGKGTKFEYESEIELNTLLPRRVIEYILSHEIQTRFKEMAFQANEKETSPYPSCKN
jgi:hypothetical protein